MKACALTLLVLKEPLALSMTNVEPRDAIQSLQMYAWEPENRGNSVEAAREEALSHF